MRSSGTQILVIKCAINQQTEIKVGQVTLENQDKHQVALSQMEITEEKA